MTVPTPRELVAARLKYQEACRFSNLSLGRAGELADLLEVRDRAHRLIALLSDALEHYRGNQVVVVAAERPEEPEFYTVDGMADRLQVSKMTVYRWVKDHPADVVSFRRSIRIRGAAVRRVIEEGE